MATFEELFGEVLTTDVVAVPVTNDGRGVPVPTGAPEIEFSAKHEGGVRLVNDLMGKQVVSTFKLLAPPNLGLTSDKHVYSLDGEANKRRPINIISHGDEDGQFYLELFFP